MNLKLDNKVVLITGGTGGIGSQIVADFLTENAIVVCLIRNEAKMDVLKENLQNIGVSAVKLHSMKCNLLDYENIKDVVKEVQQKFSTIDVLVNCAGAAYEAPFALINQDQIDSMIDLNLRSPIYLCQAVLRAMYKQKSGCIVNISSISATKKGRGITVYASAKAGLETFTRTLSQEIGRKNIRVNCIRPGLIDTEMSEGVLEIAEDIIKNQTALGRPGLPSEVSKSVLFITSEETASYITGESITVDGGMF
ncbi:MAG: 3-oxoacyl-[acyl-carrier protein] reductase [Salibacteraceae bacterium]|jgi:3-oxoacyl-[acyl-carrier protein] reductase